MERIWLFKHKSSQNSQESRRESGMDLLDRQHIVPRSGPEWTRYSPTNGTGMYLLEFHDCIKTDGFKINSINQVI